MLGQGTMEKSTKLIFSVVLSYSDLCVRFKKVFAHEHNLMSASQLMKHFKTGDAGQSKQNSEEPSGFKGHPECGFCRESFYGDDELFEHCKKNHEQCFLCIRHNIRHQYYDKYIDLVSLLSVLMTFCLFVWILCRFCFCFLFLITFTFLSLPLTGTTLAFRAPPLYGPRVPG